MVVKETVIENENKDELLKEAIKKIEKEFGKGSIMKLGDKANVDVDAISSGSLAIDYALGVGGFPRGRIIEIFGPESSGKTTIALQAIAACQKEGGRAAFIDAENAIDPKYAKVLGVDIDELFLSQPDSGEQALEITELLIRSGAIDLIVIDSVAALVPQSELEGEMGKESMGLQARLMSKAMRKLSGAMNKSNTTAIFINQLREKVGAYGNPEVTPGGRALKFFSSIRIDVRKGEAIKNNNEQIGNKVNIKVVKNKVAPPFKTAFIEMIFGEGMSSEAEVVNMASDLEIMDKSGAWYSYNGEKIGQGREAAKAYLIANPEVKEEIVTKIKEKIFDFENNE